MSLDRLKTFLEVYRARSMGRAATELGITQPAVSQQIRALEAQLARRLFRRTKRGVEPTVAADDLARDVADKIDDLDQAMVTRQTLSRSVGGLIHLGAPAEYFSYYGATLLRDLVDEGLRVQVQLGGREKIYELLSQDEIDLAITASRPDARRFAFQPIGAESLVLVAAPGLARRLRGRHLTAEVLLGLPCVAYDPELPLIRTYVEEVFGERCTAQPVAMVPDLRTLTQMCATLNAWSVVPSYLAQSSLSDGSLMLLKHKGTVVTNEFFLVWKRSALRAPRVASAKELIARSVGPARKLADAPLSP